MPLADELPRANVLGVKIHAIDMDQAVRALDEAAEGTDPVYVCVTGVHGIMEAQEDPEFRRIQNASFLTVPDGMPTVWVGRLQGHRSMKRVCGPDLILEVCKKS